MRDVHFTVKLLYCATNEAEDLFIITNYMNWDPIFAVKMDKINDNLLKNHCEFM